MSEREATFAEQSFGVRTRDARAEFGLAGYLVERMQFVQASQIQRDDGLELTAQRIESADNAGTAAERDDGDAALRAYPQDRGDVVLRAGQQHGVGRVLNPGVPASQQVERRFAACAQQPGVVVDSAVFGADDAGQRIRVGGRQCRRSQLDLSWLQFGKR